MTLTKKKVLQPAVRALLLMTALFVGGCGAEFGYKRGAGATDFQRQKQICAEQNSELNGIESCLKESGWVVVAADNPNVETQLVAPPKGPTSTRDGEPKGRAALGQEQQGSVTLDQEQRDSAGLDEVQQRSASPNLAQQAARATTNPLTQVQINSWWKLGAGPAQLLGDGADCAASLGEGHQPQTNMSRVSVALLTCMRDSGWYALQQQDHP
ncbi:MAG: hypothetical protein HRT77_16430 [Halioglobus sp.]|nr:hypothetical protein [Halioglobus sp.]